MKILKGRLHLSFDDLAQGETFLYDGTPHMKVVDPAGKKNRHKAQHVDLAAGIIYNPSEGMRVEKVELGITGMEKLECGEEP